MFKKGDKKTEDWKKKVFTQEYKEKMSKIAKERGYGKWMNGKISSRETVMKRVAKISGENNPHFAGGKMRYWRKVAFVRDDFTCQICGLRDPEIMEIDHILARSKHPELIFDLENLVTLCPNCHRRKTNREKVALLEA